MADKRRGVEKLLEAAEQHRRGAVHTRDLGNPCADCGQPGPSTMTYCEKCMIARLATATDALRRQVEALLGRSVERWRDGNGDLTEITCALCGRHSALDATPEETEHYDWCPVPEARAVVNQEEDHG